MVAQPLHPDRLSAQTAEAQKGVVGGVQLDAAGLTDSQKRYRQQVGRHVRVLPNVRRIGGAPETWEQRVTAAFLWAGQGAVISHRSAAALWRFDSCPQGFVELTTHRHLRSVAAPDVVVHRYQKLVDDEIRSLGHLLVTSPARTLLDLAAVVSAWQLERAMDSALRRREVTLPQLRLTLSRNARRGRRGVQPFRHVLDERDDSFPPLHPGLERKIWHIIKNSDLPLPHREYPIIESGREIYRIDFAYPEGLVAIEADGWRHHSDRISWSRDQSRGNVLSRRGWRVLRFTHEDATKSPVELVETIHRALRVCGPAARGTSPSETLDENRG